MIVFMIIAMLATVVATGPGDYTTKQPRNDRQFESPAYNHR